MKRLWVVLGFHSWDGAFSPSVRLADENSVGYLPVYTNKKKAKKDYPNRELRLVVMEGGTK